jgi:hypothetical protein
MRNCGECSACCRLPEIQEINKPPATPCQHLCAKGYGCKIYENRPQMCADYKCCWLMGFGAKSDIPEKSKVLVESKDTQFGLVMVAKSLCPGATETEAGRRAINRIAKNSICLVTNDNDVNRVSRIAGSKKLIRAFKIKYGIK